MAKISRFLLPIIPIAILIVVVLGLNGQLDKSTIGNLAGSAIGALAAVFTALYAIDYAATREQRLISNFLFHTSGAFLGAVESLTTTLKQKVDTPAPLTKGGCAHLLLEIEHVEKWIKKTETYIDLVQQHFFKLDIETNSAVIRLEVALDDLAKRLQPIRAFVDKANAQEIMNMRVPPRLLTEIQEFLELSTRIHLLFDIEKVAAKRSR